jgi:hypothetical protein
LTPYGGNPVRISDGPFNLTVPDFLKEGLGFLDYFANFAISDGIAVAHWTCCSVENA